MFFQIHVMWKKQFRLQLLELFIICFTTNCIYFYVSQFIYILPLKMVYVTVTYSLGFKTHKMKCFFIFSHLICFEMYYMKSCVVEKLENQKKCFFKSIFNNKKNVSVCTHPVGMYFSDFPHGQDKRKTLHEYFIKNFIVN